MSAIRPAPVTDALLMAATSDMTLATRNEGQVADLCANIFNPLPTAVVGQFGFFPDHRSATPAIRSQT